jgi:hypothetical protein
VTGKADADEWLRTLGATEVIDRSVSPTRRDHCRKRPGPALSTASAATFWPTS